MAQYGRSLPNMLRYEASRRPEIAALLDRIITITDAEIEATPVPLPWFRKALRMIRDEELKTLQTNDIIKFINEHVVDGIVPDQSGEMREWFGDRSFIRIDRGGEIEIDYGALLWLPDTGGIWIDTIMSKNIDDRVFTTSKPVQKCSKSAYRLECRKKANKNIVVSDPIQSSDGVLGQYNVRFSK